MPTTDISDMPTAAIGLVLGMSLAKPTAEHGAGRIALLIAELHRRGEYEAMLCSLDPALAQRVMLLETMDRGAAWSRYGQRLQVEGTTVDSPGGA